jgi:ABC-type multidrug transport system fused ATPase/permease subunit
MAPGSGRPILDIAARGQQDGLSAAPATAGGGRVAENRRFDGPSHIIGKLPHGLFRYIFEISWPHQLLLSALTATVFLLEVVPLELQRRAVNDLVKHRPFSLIIVLCAVYAGVIVVQGSTKLALNVYRGWVGERVKRDLRRRIVSAVERPATSSPAAEAQGIAVAIIVAEVEPIGGFVGESISEPLLQAGILLSVLAYIIHLDSWMALAAFAIFLPQLVFVPLLQRAINQRSGTRVQVLRQLGIGVIDQTGDPRAEDMRIEHVFDLDMGIFRLKFTMNFLMNLSNHLQIIAALLLGGWWVYTNNLEIGGVVAFISAMGRLNDPWGDLVNYFRDLNVTRVKFRLLADAVDQLLNDLPTRPLAPAAHVAAARGYSAGH